MVKKIFNEALIYIMAALVIFVDQYTKHLVRINLGDHATWQPLPALAPYARVLHITNTGAAFGMFQQGGLFFTVIAIIVSGIIVAYSFRLPSGGQWGMRLVLGLQLGGALGNLVDRLQFGPVTDFISLTLFNIDMPIFNLADLSITSGVVLMLILMLFESRRKPLQPGPVEAGPADAREPSGM